MDWIAKITQADHLLGFRLKGPEKRLREKAAASCTWGLWRGEGWP